VSEFIVAGCDEVIAADEERELLIQNLREILEFVRAPSEARAPWLT